MWRHLLPALLLAGCAGLREPVLPPALERHPGAAAVELTDVPFFPQRDYQCGPASLAAVLRHSGVDVDAEGLRPRVYLPARQGSLAVELTAAARTCGRIAYPIPTTLRALLAELQAGRPVVVLQNLGLESAPLWHFAVVIGYDARRDAFVLRSGETRRLELRAYDFMRTWSLADQWGLVVLAPGELPAADDADGYVRAVTATEAVNPDADLTAAYAAAVGRWPESALAQFGLANAVRRTGDDERAIDLYAALLERWPDQVAARNNLADALASVGCRSLAMQTIDAALAGTSPDHPARAVLEQTRAEIVARDGQPEPDQCARWARAVEAR